MHVRRPRTHAHTTCVWDSLFLCVHGRVLCACVLGHWGDWVIVCARTVRLCVFVCVLRPRRTCGSIVLALSTIILPSSATTSRFRMSASASLECAARPRSTSSVSARVFGTFFLLAPPRLPMAAPRRPGALARVLLTTGAGQRTTAGAKQHGASPPAWQPASAARGAAAGRQYQPRSRSILGAVATARIPLGTSRRWR